MSETLWDAAIISGGPAGSSAAINLARSGLRVILLESKTYPHDKLCGEFLSPECTGLLDALGVREKLQALNPVTIHTATLTAADGSAWETHLPGKALGISRRALDAALAEQAQQAGSTVREAVTVSGLRGSLESGFELAVTGRSHTETVCARAVIGAHGRRSALDRELGRRFIARRHPFVALKAHFHGPPIPGRIELHAFPGGYCGMSEIEGGLKVVCMLVSEQVFRQQRGPGMEGPDGFVRWMKEQNIYLRSWLQWADRVHERWISIAQVPFLTKPLVEQDVLMAGDAAGTIVPLAGNGIAMALESGRMAAGHLARYLSGEIKAADLRRAYPAEWKRRFAARLRLGQLLQPLLLQPRAASLALRLFNAFPRAGQLLIENTRSPITD